MKVFIDANIIISVFNREYPLFSYSARVLSLADNSQFKLYTSPLCLAISYYFATKKCSAVQARQKIRLLAEKLFLTENKREDVIQAASHKSISDFEDGLQYYAALNAGCACIVTDNVKDFYFANIEVCTAEDFLVRHVLKIK